MNSVSNWLKRFNRLSKMISSNNSKIQTYLRNIKQHCSNINRLKPKLSSNSKSMRKCSRNWSNSIKTFYV